MALADAFKATLFKSTTATRGPYQYGGQRKLIHLHSRVCLHAQFPQPVLYSIALDLAYWHDHLPTLSPPPLLGDIAEEVEEDEEGWLRYPNCSSAKDMGKILTQLYLERKQKLREVGKMGIKLVEDETVGTNKEAEANDDPSERSRRIIHLHGSAAAC